LTDALCAARRNRMAVETGDPDPILWKLGDGAGKFLWKWAKLRLRSVLEPEIIKIDFACPLAQQKSHCVLFLTVESFEN